MASEMGEYYTAKRKERQERNAKRWTANVKTIRHLSKSIAGFAFQDLDKHMGHLRVHYRGIVCDFWPSTGTVILMIDGENTRQSKPRRGFDAGSLYRWMKRLANERDAQAPQP